jgi:hypothetical protein
MIRTKADVFMFLCSRGHLSSGKIEFVDEIEVLHGQTAKANITFWGEYISSYMKINARFYIVSP